MIKINKQHNTILIILSLLSVTIGYAVLNSTVTINGKSTIQKNTWDVHFENIKVTEGSVTPATEPTIENNTTVDFEVNLNLPGEYYEFTVDVVNKGTMDAMISSIEKTPDLTTAQQKYLNYLIEYQNGEQIETKQLVKQNEFVRLKIRVEYKKDISASDLPSSVDTLNLGFNINYVQSDGTGSNVTDNGVKKTVTANGSLDDIGTVVTIGTEQFYTIGTDGDNVKLLSMMNITLDDAPIQTQETITTSFALKYSESEFEKYVDNYKNELEKYNVTVAEARLIVDEDLINDEIGCSSSSCINAPNFIYSFSYWTGLVNGAGNAKVVYSDGTYGKSKYDTEGIFCIRPVIIIPKSDILKNNSEQEKTLIEFTIDDTTYQAEEGMTWGEWVDSEYNIRGFTLKTGDHYIYVDSSSDNVILDSNSGIPVYDIEMIKNYDYILYSLSRFP